MRRIEHQFGGRRPSGSALGKQVLPDLTFGAREGRDPSANFDTDGYLVANPDVAAAGINPLQHFLEFGSVEGRTPVNDGTFA